MRPISAPNEHARDAGAATIWSVSDGEGPLVFPFSLRFALAGCSLPGLHYDPESPPPNAPSPRPAIHHPAGHARPAPHAQLGDRRRRHAARQPGAAASCERLYLPRRPPRRARHHRLEPSRAHHLPGPGHPAQLHHRRHPALPALRRGQRIRGQQRRDHLLPVCRRAEGGSGETVDEIRAQLAQALQGYTRDAQIDVRVVGFRSQHLPDWPAP